MLPDSITTNALLVLSALAAGAINALAGGGTLLTFPALLSVVSPVVANGTSTVALAPGSLASAWGYRRELRAAGQWALWLTVPSAVGGTLGTLLVTRLDEKYFATLVPWLILTATLLFMLQPTLIRVALRLRPAGPPDPDRWSTAAFAGLMMAQLLIAVYGGYFGAGIGILMLSSLGLMGLADIHQMNAVKALLAVFINGLATVVFILERKVNWPIAIVMAGAAVLGGYLGAHFGRRLPRGLVRWIVIVIGLGLAAMYFAEQWRS